MVFSFSLGCFHSLKKQARYFPCSPLIHLLFVSSMLDIFHQYWPGRPLLSIYKGRPFQSYENNCQLSIDLEMVCICHDTLRPCLIRGMRESNYVLHLKALANGGAWFGAFVYIADFQCP